MSEVPSAADYEAAKQIKEQLIDHFMKPWLSKENVNEEKPVNGLFMQQWHFGEDQEATPDALWAQEKPNEGWYFIDFDNLPCPDQELREERERIQTLLEDRKILLAVNKLLEKEIDEEGLCAFDCESIFDVPPTSELNLQAKIDLIVKFKHLYQVFPTTSNKPDPKPEPEPEKGKMKMSMLRITAFDTLHVETFVAPIVPEYCHDCFRALLEDVAEPYLHAGISNRTCLDRDLLDIPEAKTVKPATEEGQEERYMEWELERKLSSEVLASWSYLLLDTCASEGPLADPNTVYLLWLPIDNEEQYKKMLSSVKDKGSSPMFIRTWKLNKAMRVAINREREASRSKEPPTNQA